MVSMSARRFWSRFGRERGRLGFSSGGEDLGQD